MKVYGLPKARAWTVGMIWPEPQLWRFMDCPRARAWTARMIWPKLQFMECLRARAWTMIPAVQALALGQSINLHRVQNWCYCCFLCNEQLLSHNMTNFKVWITACRINLRVEINRIRVFYGLMIHNSVLFVQFFAGGTITYMDQYSARLCYYRE